MLWGFRSLASVALACYCARVYLPADSPSRALLPTQWHMSKIAGPPATSIGDYIHA